MAGHEHVYGICENKCRVETMSKGQIEGRFNEVVDLLTRVYYDEVETSCENKYKGITASGVYPDNTFKRVIDLPFVTNFNKMFRECTGLTKVSDLDTRSGTDFNYTFYGCTSLTEVCDLDLSKLNGNHNGYMFNGCTSLTTFTDNPKAPEGKRWQFNDTVVGFDDVPLDRNSILKVFNGLIPWTGTVEAQRATVRISSTTNGYLSAADKAIAENKGWAVFVVQS